MLANKGYDIWLGNSRGNKHSKASLKDGNKKKDFWAFSFMHMAKYDLPAAFEYINSKTG